MAELTSWQIISNLRQDLTDYAGKWRGYFNGVAEAYAAAFKSQADILLQIQKKIEARRKEEAELMTFGLSLLTAGFGGMLSTYFSKKLVTTRAQGAGVSLSEDDEIFKELLGKAEKAVGMLKDAAAQTAIATSRSERAKRVLDSVQIAIGTKSGDTPTEPFVPAGITPEEYGERLKQGAEERGNVIADLLRPFSDIAPIMPTLMAKAVDAKARQSEFFTKAPPSVMSNETKALLLKRAKLMLWLVWALSVPDRDFWKIEKTRSYLWRSQIWDWGPLREELIRLQVPAAQITWRTMRLEPEYHETMDMVGFIDWARDPAVSLALIFSGSQQSKDQLTKLKNRMSKRVLGK